MGISITINTDDLTRLDWQIIAALGSIATGPVDEQTKNPDPEPEATKPSPSKTTKKTKTPEPAPAPAPEAEEVVEAEIVEDEAEATEDSVEALMEQAVQKATKLVSDGKASEVKSALEKAGARRVSELKDETSIRTFLDAL